MERKRLEVPAAMWSTEYALQEPTRESRALEPGSVGATVRFKLGMYRGAPVENVEIEPPEEGGRHSTGRTGPKSATGW